jgi:putative oxidoreductase
MRIESITSTGYATLVVRLALGVVFLAHGLTKVFVFTLPGTAAFFESVGFPGFLAYPVTAAEIVGGLLLVVGLASRWAALGLVPVMLGALSVHWGNGWVFNAPNGGWEFPALLAAVCLAYFVRGEDGAWALGAPLEGARTSSRRREAVRQGA